jgi:fatty-acyl-CoA synthase
VLGDTGATTLFFLPEFRGSMLSEVLSTAVSELPKLENIFDIRYKGDDYPGLSELTEIGARRGSDAQLQQMQSSVHCTDVAMILYTSGTTGRPKGAQLSHRSVVNSARETSRDWEINEMDRYCNPFPFFHISGSVLVGLASVWRGACHLPLPWFSTERMLTTISAESVTACWFVPTMLLRALEEWSCRPKNYDVSALRVCGIGGSTTPVGLHAQVKSLWNAPLRSAYGSTEMASGIAQVKIQEKLECATGVGRPLPGVELRLVNDEGELVALGRPGSLQARGYMMMVGYLDESNGGLDDDGWITPGDLAVMDSHGCLTIVGRTTEMIIRGGENLYPVEIESRILDHPDVIEVAVVGVPDPEYGEEACACVRVRQSGYAGEVLRWLSERVAREKVPRYIVPVEEFPMSSTGKISKVRLQEMVVSSLVNPEAAASLKCLDWRKVRVGRND